MKITKVQIHLTPPSWGSVKAFATVTLDGKLVLNEIKVIESHDAPPHILYPRVDTRTSSSGAYYPTDNELKQQIARAVIRAYNDVASSGKRTSKSTADCIQEIIDD